MKDPIKVKTLLSLLLLSFLGSGLAQAAGNPATDSPAVATAETLQVEKAVFCTGIEDRVPVGIASSFSASVGRVYLHTAVSLPKGESATIQHVWKRNGQVVSTVDLEVRGPRWRTRSYKTSPASGNWTVDITAGGKVLESVSFTIQ